MKKLEKIECLADTSLGRYPPGRHRPWADTVLGQTPPPLGRHPLPWADTTLGIHPPRTDTPPWQRTPWADKLPPPSRQLLQRTVRILLECILFTYPCAVN